MAYLDNNGVLYLWGKVASNVMSATVTEILKQGEI